MDVPVNSHRSYLKDVFSVIIFVSCVIAGTLLINTFIFRSFSVIGPSMEKTLYTGDRLIVNRIPVTIAQIQNKAYVPERGKVIVFKNPNYTEGLNTDQFIVKRVIAFSGERVVLKDGHFTVYNNKYPKGFNPDDDNNGEPGDYTFGQFDDTVPNGFIFVSGDHRDANGETPWSYDSRNGLGYIPLFDVVGPVSARIFPFNKIRFF